MGLIQMAKSAITSEFADQIVEYFRCEDLTQEHLCKPATQVKRGKSINNATESVISNGSTFDVAVGQAALLVENGKVHDFVIANNASLAGKYTYDSKTQPSVLGDGVHDIIPSLKDIVNRFAAGGQSTNTMRLMYVNLKPLTGNKIGFGNVPFRDGEMNFTLKAQGHGTFEFVIADPIAFYEKIILDMFVPITRTSDTGALLLEQMKSEMKPKFQKALTLISTKRIPYDQIGLFPDELAESMNKELTEKWQERGIKLTSLAIELNVDEESAKLIQDYQKAATLGGNAAIFSGMNAMSVNEARVAAANNDGGAMMGFMGMGLAGMSAAMNQPAYPPNQTFPTAPAPQQAAVPAAPAPAAEAPAASWTCACGVSNTGKFCLECGAKKPEEGWTCACGVVNKGKFCTECGGKRPVDAPVYQCDKCGFKPADPKNPPKFCPECGDPFNDADAK
ncbi:MAG: SPFH domain-containing protein [Oscillospiraceae bacterium]